jgi:hypothetical protein
MCIRDRALALHDRDVAERNHARIAADNGLVFAEYSKSNGGKMTHQQLLEQAVDILSRVRDALLLPSNERIKSNEINDFIKKVEEVKNI